MNLYRFEVTLTIEEEEVKKNVEVTRSVNVVIVAKDDQSAFTVAEVEVEKHYLKLPKIIEVVLLEKKRIGNGGGYVIDEAI